MQADENLNIKTYLGDTAGIVYALDGYTLAAGDSIVFSIKRNTGDNIVLYEKNIVAAGTEINIDLTDLKLGVGYYNYDILLKTAENERITILGPKKFNVLEVAHNVKN